MIDLKIKLIHPEASIPVRATAHAGGWDVFAADIIKESEDFYIVDLGFQLEIPNGYKLTLVPRSSITKTKWIQQNSPGLGDCDYRGTYQYRFRCIPNSMVSSFDYQNFPFKVGDRIGQIYLEEVLPIQFIQVEELGDTERGEGGFGSTGK